MGFAGFDRSPHDVGRGRRLRILEHGRDLGSGGAAQDRVGRVAIDHLDLGGGLGVRYQDETPPEPAEYAGALLQRLRSVPYEIFIEPGRAIAANAGVLLTRVEYLKHNEDKDFAIVDAAMNDLIRPSLYSAWQKIISVDEHPKGRAGRYDLVGPVCETGDFLGRGRELPELAPLPSDVRFSLAVIAGSQAGSVFPITKPRSFIGRGSAMDVQLKDSEVSRRHAMVEVRDEEATLIDLGATNGTFVDGKRVPRNNELRLRSGARIKLAKALELEFLLPRYEEEGKSYLTIGIGCTGGRHRSVALAEELGEWLTDHDVAVTIRHRDADA